FAVAAAVIGPKVPRLLAQAERIRELHPSRVRRGLRIAEWMSRVIGGLDPEPSSIRALGGSSGMLAAIPAALPDLLDAPELLDGLRCAAPVPPARLLRWPRPLRAPSQPGRRHPLSVAGWCAYVHQGRYSVSHGKRRGCQTGIMGIGPPSHYCICGLKSPTSRS